MSQFRYEIRDAIAWVVFDSGRLNTLSSAAVADLAALLTELRAVHDKDPLRGAILRGNSFGLGAGADIKELMNAAKAELTAFIDAGHAALCAIEDSAFPWVALIDGFALGGVYELALACHGIVATQKSSVGFPEIRLNIFPGLGGTQRLPRRTGFTDADDPMRPGPAFGAILNGGNFKAPAAAALHMIDRAIPEGENAEQFAVRFLVDTLPLIDHTPPADPPDVEALRAAILPAIKKATLGRANPRAPFAALDVMIRGAALPLREAIQIERDAFLEVAASSQAKAGMRFFFTQQKVQKLPKSFPGKAGELHKIGIDGADGFMGNAIAWLALRAGYEVVCHVPVARLAGSVRGKLGAKYGRLLKAGKITQLEVEKIIRGVNVTTDMKDLFDSDLVIEARVENRDIKAEFFRALGGGVRGDTLVASNSSSMGPGLLGGFFAEGGGNRKKFLNLHFFSPAEHPSAQLVELIAGDETEANAVATAHRFIRSINKTPVILRDGSPGFLVNAGLAEYFRVAEEIYREGTPIETIDAAVRKHVLPVGPFQLADQAGLDVVAGLFDTLAAAAPPAREPLVWKMRAQKRFGAKNGAGYYTYEGRKRRGPWPELASLAPERGDRTAGDEEIVERCVHAFFDKARKLCDRGIVASEEECDLAFMLGIGFAKYLGGPIFFGKLRRWEPAGPE